MKLQNLFLDVSSNGYTEEAHWGPAGHILRR